MLSWQYAAADLLCELSIATLYDHLGLAQLQ